MKARASVSAAARMLEDVAAVIGQPHLLALCKALGGTKIFIPARIAHNHTIAQAIGMKASALLSEHFSGFMIDLPKAFARRERVIELALSGEMTVAEAALACDYTERRVYQLLAERKNGANDDQMDLFA